MIAPQIRGPSWLHDLSVRVKLAVLALSSVLLFPVADPFVLGICLTLVLALYASLGLRGFHALASLKTLLPVLLFIFVAHVLLVSRSTGTVVVLRLATLILLAYLVTLTSRMDAVIEALRPLLRPLRVIGLSETRVALAIALVLRFVPVLAGLGAQLSEAHRARSGRPGRFKVVAPLCLQALNAADHVAEALAARGGVDPQPDNLAITGNRPRHDG
ncbi:energy-coupling factor transporter transmembrane protein EcfT [Stappia sp. ES.058]|uniref:energy-coupling factor transporter transmembrane component T family protein n=1 Tax=Stappia sp. ES.058 TaxID=1881061 RepID=UPI00087A7D81|nr:energy-coupling factor transporter transmembrane protein EcfT [Stappia sp. ES.058]SDU37472.1 biotin transport system permease protein [Stappia sp. ES.058]